MSMPSDTPPGRSELRAENTRLRAELALLQRHDDLAMIAANEARSAIARVRELCADDYWWPEFNYYDIHSYEEDVLRALDGAEMRRGKPARW